MKRRFAILTVLFFFSPFGCTSRPSASSPPKIHFGEDICAVCSMIVSDERFSSAITFTEGRHVEAAFYDDVGEMLEARPPEGSSLYWWAHDADSLEWIDAKAAFYLFSDSLRTPMGTGVAAFRTREAATRASQTWPGEILDFAEARAR